MESDAAGHIAATVSKQGAVHAGTQLRFSFWFSLGSQPKECCYPHLGWVFFLASVHLVGKHSQTYPEVCFYGGSKAH